MGTSCDDLLELSDYAWQRLRTRLTGLSDAEYRWEPLRGDQRTFITLTWRLSHIVDFLTEQRNAAWLGLPGTDADRGAGLGEAEPGNAKPGGVEAGDAGQALAALDDAYASWRALLVASSEESLAAPIGEPAGRFGTATRRSFVLHILDELIHHGAEAALLRDLYAATHTGSSHLLPGTSTNVP